MAFALRCFFDPGSGICLWANNDEARERFGYPIDHWNREGQGHAFSREIEFGPSPQRLDEGTIGKGA